MSDLDEINNSLAEFEEELSKLKSASDLINEAKDTAQLTLDESKEILKRLIETSQKATADAIKKAQNLNKSANKLLNTNSLLLKKLDNVDFPTRLDKVEKSQKVNLILLLIIFILMLVVMFKIF